jgi:hypothetical protein
MEYTAETMVIEVTVGHIVITMGTEDIFGSITSDHINATMKLDTTVPFVTTFE